MGKMKLLYRPARKHVRWCNGTAESCCCGWTDEMIEEAMKEEAAKQGFQVKRKPASMNQDVHMRRLPQGLLLE